MSRIRANVVRSETLLFPLGEEGMKHRSPTNRCRLVHEGALVPEKIDIESKHGSRMVIRLILLIYYKKL